MRRNSARTFVENVTYLWILALWLGHTRRISLESEFYPVCANLDVSGRGRQSSLSLNMDLQIMDQESGHACALDRQPSSDNQLL